MILVAVRLDIGISLQWKLVTFNWGNVLRIGGGPTPNHPLSRGPGSRKGPPGGVYISNNFQKIIRRIWVLERIPIKSYWNAILKRYKSTSEIGNFSFGIRNVDCILSFNGTVSSLKRYEIFGNYCQQLTSSSFRSTSGLKWIIQHCFLDLFIVSDWKCT